MSSKCLVSDCRQRKPVSSPHKSARKLVLLCSLGKTHPGRLALMFIQPLLAVATKDAVIWRWKSSRAQSSKRGSARSSKTLKSRPVCRAPLSAHLHRYTRASLRHTGAFLGYGPATNILKSIRRGCWEKWEKIQMKSNTWALSWRIQKQFRLFQGVTDV